MCVNTREHGCGRPARKPRGAQGRSVSCARTPCVRSAVSGPRLAGTRGARLTHLTPRLPPGAAQRGGGPERAGRAAAAARGAAAGPAHSQRGAARRQHRPVRALLAPCFEQLPEGVSALTALEELRLGRHAAGELEIGGSLDARALGSLAGFPNLCELGFSCCVLICPSFQASAAHPRLKRLQLDTSYPAPGPSCMAFLGFVYDLLQQGRPGVLELIDGVEGAGRQDSRDFRGALRAVGYPLNDADAADLV